MRTRSDKQALLWTGGILGAAAVFLVLLCGPQFKRIRGLGDLIRSAEQDVADGPVAVDLIASIEREVASLADRAADLDEQVPNQDRVGVFLEELSRRAEARGLTTGKVSPGLVVRTKEVTALPITFEVRGPFPRIHGLMRDLERMTRVTRIDRFEARVDDERPGMVFAEVSLRIYYRSL